MPDIRLIIWDIGGVLVRTQDPAPRQQLAEHHGMQLAELEDLVFGGIQDNPAQLGHISQAQHWRDLGRTLGLDENQTTTFRRQFFAGDRVDQELSNTITQLKKEYSIAALSNAFSNMRSLMRDEWRILYLFDHIVISAEVGLMKPDTAIYRLTLETCGYTAADSVFIDDTAVNVLAAEKIGIRGIQFISRQQTIDELNAVLKDR